MNETYGIPIACAVMAVLLLWFVIGTKGYWLLKMAVTIVSLYFCVCLWFSLNGLLGWPTEESLINQKVQVLWTDVKEPNKKTKDPGAVYAWIKHLEPEENQPSFVFLFHDKQSENEPRLHKLPYNRAMHQQATQINDMISKGGKFYGELQDGGQFKGEGDGKGGEGEGEGGEGKNKRKGKGKQGGGSLSQKQEMMFHQLPPPFFQQKDPNGN